MIDKHIGREIVSPADRLPSDGTGIDQPNVPDHPVVLDSGASDGSPVFVEKATRKFWEDLPKLTLCDQAAEEWSQSASQKHGMPESPSDFARCLKMAFMTGVFYVRT